MKVYILTSEYNDYDQHGEYFEDVFKDKPSIETLKGRLNVTEEEAACILNGEDRGGKYVWYYLREVLI